MTEPHEREVAPETELAAVRRLPRVVRRAIALQIAIALGPVLPMMLAVFILPDFGGWIMSLHVGALAALAVLSTLPLFAIVWGGIRMNRLRSRIIAARGALCPECCYPLVSIESGTCPECGWPGDVGAARRAWKDAGMWIG